VEMKKHILVDRGEFIGQRPLSGGCFSHAW
jgi:hypothetical protein